MRSELRFFIALGLCTLTLIYITWYYPASTNTANLKVGMIYWPIIYNQTDALNQLQQIHDDGFRMWETTISPDIQTGSQGYYTLKACLALAKQLGIETMLALDTPYNTNASRYQEYLNNFVEDFNTIHFGEIDRYVDANENVTAILQEWYSHIPNNIPIVISWTAGYVFNYAQNIKIQLNQLSNHRIDALGISVYAKFLPEVTLPVTYKFLQTFGKPVWVTEIGDHNINWIINQLGILRKNGITKAYIWNWQTFWGDLNYNIKNTEKETAIKNWLSQSN